MLMNAQNVTWSLVGGSLLIGTALVVWLLSAFAPQPQTSGSQPQAPRVSTAAVEVHTGPLHVRGTGTVRPVHEIQLTAEVGGRLVEVSDAFVSGGAFEAGATLARIDPSDYQSAVQQARSAVTQARVQLLQAQQEARAARADYERIRERTGARPSPDTTELGRLLFNEPQVAQAQSVLESARATLRTANANLERTRLRVPFDGRVRQKQADLGAYVAPGTPVATVYGTDAAEIVVALPARTAALLPNLWARHRQPSADPLPALVTRSYGDRAYSWNGRVHRVNGAVNEKTRTVDVVVRVSDPYDQPPTVSPQNDTAPPPPLAVGSYVTVDIEARRAEAYHIVPRRAVRTRTPDQPPVVWTVEGDSMLVEQTVQPIQTVDERTYLAATLPPGTRVITTDLSVQTDSMAVRIAR